LDRERHKVVYNFLNDIPDTITFLAIVNWWVKDDISVLQIYPDIEDWQQLVVLVIWNTNLIGKEAHRRADTLGDTSNNEAVNVVDVRHPGRGLSVWLDMLKGVL
jgi:hypothetical protein